MFRYGGNPSRHLNFKNFEVGDLLPHFVNRDNLLTDYRLNEADNMDVNKEKAECFKTS